MMTVAAQEVREAVSSLRSAVDAIDRKISHEEMRLQRGLEGQEADAAGKYVGELHQLRNDIEAHADAVSNAVNEGAALPSPPSTPGENERNDAR
jgi:hypothetical protein